MSHFDFNIESKLPKDAKITIKYREDDPDWGSEIRTKSLYVVEDSVRSSTSEQTMYGYHETIVDPNLTSGKYFLLTYEIYRDGTIGNIGRVSPKSLGYEYLRVTISGLKIIEMKTKEKLSIWRASTMHTGFQLQKIW